MRVEQVTAQEFLSQAGGFLNANEASNNMLLGHARRVGEKPDAMHDPLKQQQTRFFVLRKDDTIEDDDKKNDKKDTSTCSSTTTTAAVCGAAMLTPGFPVLFAVPTTIQAALAMEDHLRDEELVGVNGPDEASKAFAQQRATRQAAASSAPPWVPSTALYCYAVTPASFRPVPLQSDSTTTLRWLDRDRAADVALLEQLAQDFGRSVNDANINGRMVAQRFRAGSGKSLILQQEHETTMEQQQGHLLEATCALATSMRSTARYGVVNMVYTPDAWRRQGCASRVVSAMVEHFLQEKEGVALFADQNKVGPNRLYQSLGFSVVSTLQLYEKASPASSE